MLVRDVLLSKSRRVVTIDSEATINEGIAKLVQNNIGSLPVLDHSGRMVGIISQRDMLRIIHNRGEGFGRFRIAEFMTQNPVICGLEDDVNDIMGKMSERRISKIPVLDGTQLVGIISIGDVVNVLYDKVATENQHLISYIHGSV